MIRVQVAKKIKETQIRFSFSLKTNRAVVFGPSGSGKSTLLKMIAGFFPPDAGEISIRETLIFSASKKVNLPIHLRNFGYLPQDFTLFPNMTVRQNILYGLKARKIPENQKHVETIVTKFGIAKKLDEMPADLSGGQQQRVALARIILMNPDVLLLDEPFSALDRKIRESLRDLVIDLSEEMNIPVIFVTHDLEEAYVFGQELVVIDKGEVIEYGDRESLFRAPEYIETATLLDFHNIWPLQKGGDKPDNNTFCCIRPEDIMIHREDRPLSDAQKHNMITGTVTGLHLRGRYAKIEMAAGEQGYVIHLPDHAFQVMDIHKGKKIKCSLKAEALVHCRSMTAK
jgi:molybdate transport system ATP-binding protein